MACVFVSLSSGCRPALNQAKHVKPDDALNQLKRVKPHIGVFSSAAENVDEFVLSHGRKPKLLERWDIEGV